MPDQQWWKNLTPKSFTDAEEEFDDEEEIVIDIDEDYLSRVTEGEPVRAVATRRV